MNPRIERLREQSFNARPCISAERALLEMDVSRKKRADRIDSAAAAFILQGALDRLSSLSADKAE